MLLEPVGDSPKGYEAAAEFVHKRLRAAWGFADPAELTLQDTFSAGYRGKRYSFGYPACPDLADGDMMAPEGSVSAIVFHHPDARYFGV